MPYLWHFVIEKMNHLRMMCTSPNTHNKTKRFIAVKHSRRSVERKAHAVPSIRFEQQRLTWIDNLETGSRRRLDDPRHPDHAKPFVQDYLKRFGARKVEANALVVRPDAGRELCHQAITKYVSPDLVSAYEATLHDLREQVQAEVQRLVGVR